MTVRKMISPYSHTSFGLTTVVLLIGLFSFFVPSIASAVPKGPGGQTCKSSGTTTVNGKEEGTGRDMKCTADYCKYDECQTSGPNIGKCYEKTSYSNVRDCKAAARTQIPQNQIRPGQMAPQIQGQPKQPSQRAPKFQDETIRRRGIEGEQSVDPALEAPTESAPTEPEPVEQSSGTKSQ